MDFTEEDKKRLTDLRKVLEMHSDGKVKAKLILNPIALHPSEITAFHNVRRAETQELNSRVAEMLEAAIEVLEYMEQESEKTI